MYKVSISVRNLIEFILRSGDIDNRMGSGGPDADSMQEGQRIHRMIQKRAGSDYRAEIPLAYVFTDPDEECEITVEGRADGVIHNSHGVTVDEIKSTYADVMAFKEAKEIHMAQAMFYAYIIALNEELPVVTVRITYVNIATEETRYFNTDLLFEELESFTSKICRAYVKWAVFDAKRREIRNGSIHGLPFPFAYRDGQDELVRQVYYTIHHGRKLFLEAPTGVGKTVTTVYPSVMAMGQGLADRIFYLTAKTVTRIVADECVNILTGNGLRAKSIVLTAKEKICLSGGDCNPDACPYAKGHFDRINDILFTMLTENDRYTRDTIIDCASQHMVCPFELSLDISLFCDVIICDYNYAFDPRAKLKRFFADETGEPYIFLIDEAHNLVDRAREMFSASVVREDYSALKAVTAADLPGMSRKFQKVYKALSALKAECDATEQSDIPCLRDPMTDPVVQALLNLYADMENFFKQERRSDKKKTYPKEVVDAVLESYFEIGHFLNMYELVDENYSVYAAYNESGDFFLKLMCVNPGRNLRECMNRARSTVLFSATLLPLKYHKNLLGGVPEDYEVYAKSVFDPAKRGLFIARDVTSKYTRRGAGEYHKIAAYIHEITSAKPGNYMVFMPSYRFIDEVYSVYEAEFEPASGTECLKQSPSMDEAEREAFLARFREPVPASDGGMIFRPSDPLDDIFDMIDMEIETEEPNTLIGFCVMGGIFSEGIDLKNDSLIGVIIVGTGIPQVCLERNLMKERFDLDGDDGYEYSYKFPGMNKVLQAAGRVIRTEQDVGIVTLLDERFLQRGYLDMFPREWYNYRAVTLQNVGNEISSFWEKKDKEEQGL